MRHGALLTVAFLVVLAGAGATGTVTAELGGGPTARIVGVNGSVNYVSVPAEAVVQSETTTQGLAVGTALAADASSLRTRLDRHRFERSFDTAEGAAGQRAVVRETLDRIDRRTAALEQRNDAAVGAYANGSMGADQFVRERARIQAEAGDLEGTLDAVARVARRESDLSLSTGTSVRIANLGGTLQALQGPVSGRYLRAVNASGAGGPLYVEASPEGYTLAYVTQETYVRETYLAGERDPDGTDQFAAGTVPRRNEAHNRGFELYPWATNNSVSPNTFGLGTTGIYRFSVDFVSGRVTAYIDGATTNVFRESQRHAIASMATTRSATTTNGSVRLAANRTYETGPMSLSLTRTTTGEPVRATIVVGSTTVGRTGADGTHWIIEPRGRVRVQATTADGTTLTVRV